MYYRTYSKKELFEFVGKLVVLHLDEQEEYPKGSIKGKIVDDGDDIYILHNNPEYEGSCPDDLEGYKYGFGLYGLGIYGSRIEFFNETDTNIKIINRSTNQDPEYATEDSAGCDLRAFITEPIVLNTLERASVPTGIFIELPKGYEAQIRPRSGLALNHGITVLNTPGTIDADYRGEIKVILVNLSNTPFTINSRDRICQMVVSKYEKLSFQRFNELSATDRGNGGFGHTGNK